MDGPRRGRFVPATPNFDGSSVVEAQTVEQQSHQEQPPDLLSAGGEGPSWTDIQSKEHAPYPTRLRVMLGLSLLSWALVIAAAIGFIWAIKHI